MTSPTADKAGVAAWPADRVARFNAKIIRHGPNECWTWIGCRQSRGYGSFGWGPRPSKSILAHRAAWELANGPIPDGLTIDHLCLNKICMNPAHMEVVTRAVNASRGNKLRFACEGWRQLRVTLDFDGFAS